METLNLTTSADTAPAANPKTRRTVILALEKHAPEPTGRVNASGLAWTYRNGFNGVLSLVPAQAWATPAKQGWSLVKANSAREVWRAALHGHTYFVKYYYRQGWQAHLKRWVRGPACLTEWRGGIFAIENGIAAVRPAGFVDGVHCGGRICSILVTEAIEPAYSLDQHWLMLQSDQNVVRRREDVGFLIERLAEMIAHAHQAGFEHLDMHPANILVQPQGARRYRTLFVDLQCARLGVPIDDRAVVRNLTQLNQWFRRHSTTGDQLRFLRAYIRWRNEHELRFQHGRPLEMSFEQLVAKLAACSKRHADRLFAQRDRRAARNGRYFAKLNVADGWRGLVSVQPKKRLEEAFANGPKLDRSWWKQTLAEPLRFFDVSDEPPLKDSHSALVRRATLQHADTSLSVIVKRPLARNFWRWLRLAMVPSRSMRGWKMGHALLNREIPAARPLAVLQQRIGPFVRDSILICEFLGGARCLESHMRELNAEADLVKRFREKRALAAKLGRELRKLHDRGFVHRDCKAQNLLIQPFPLLRIFWIDMDGIRRPSRPTQLQHCNALMRLYVSLVDVPGFSRTDRAHFLKAYCATFGVRRDAWKILWRSVAPLAEKKLQALTVRRAWKLEKYGRI